MNNRQEVVQCLKVSVVLPVAIDGTDPIAPIKASLPGESSPVAWKVYRQWYDDHRDELTKKGGVYIQIGKKFKDESGEDQEEREAVYVGKTNDFCRRFTDHDQQRNVNVLRVINNPFFYKDANASDGRLVEVAQDMGFRYALDRAAVLPAPSVIAQEIALLNHGMSDEANVTAVVEKLSCTIGETIIDWGLIKE